MICAELGVSSPRYATLGIHAGLPIYPRLFDGVI